MNENHTNINFNWQNREFLSYVISFNYLPCFYLHPSRITEVCPDENLWNKLMMYKNGKNGLSELILSFYGLQGQYFYEFSKPYHLLVILPQDVFNKLLFFTASFINFKFVNNIIEKNSLKSIKNTLGEELYYLVLHKAKFIIGNTHIDFLLSDFNDISLRINDTKKKLIEYLFGLEPYPLTKRIEIRFPTNINISFNNKIDEDKKKGLWNITKKILLQDVNPQCRQFIL